MKFSSKIETIYVAGTDIDWNNDFEVYVVCQLFDSAQRQSPVERFATSSRADANTHAGQINSIGTKRQARDLHT